MRHRKAGRKLNRSPSHRLALKRNLARALFEHGRIITTLEKAKEMRPFVEKLITLAKKGTLQARRMAIAKLNDREIVNKLFSEIGPQFANRPGGYCRVIKRQERRLGDGGRTAYLALLGADEPIGRDRQRAEQPTAPRLKVEEDEQVATTEKPEDEQVATTEKPEEEQLATETEEKSEAEQSGDSEVAEEEKKPAQDEPAEEKPAGESEEKDKQ